MTPPHDAGSRECREMFARLSEYLDEELDPVVCEEIDEHLGDCPPCQAFLESLRRTIDWTQELPRTELSAEFKRELIDAYRKIGDVEEK